MSKLTHIEKQKLERELGMGGGCVLNFSNRTFEEFFREVVGVEIYDARYDHYSGSKANRMRKFWDLATDEQLRFFVNGIVDGWTIYSSNPMPDSGRVLFCQILDKLGGQPGSSEQYEAAKTASHIAEDVGKELNSKLIQVSCLPAQQRGFEFERFLKDFFDAYGLASRASFRLTGEQIDGSFVLHNETYLLEAKWQNAPTAVEDLHAFQGKVEQKAAWSRGLFVSISGFSDDGLVAFGRGKSVICMDGGDLAEILTRRLSVADVLAAKVRRAAETGSPFVRVRDIVT